MPLYIHAGMNGVIMWYVTTLSYKRYVANNFMHLWAWRCKERYKVCVTMLTWSMQLCMCNAYGYVYVFS